MKTDSLTRTLQRRLEGTAQTGLRRRRIPLAAAGPAAARLDGRTLTDFCSNDYLGLWSDPALIAAFKKGADEYGVGSGASALISGYSDAHRELEAALANYLQRDAVVLFSSGYLANLAVATALVGRGDTIIEDKLNHASLIDGGRLSDARMRRYRHADSNALRQRLKSAPDGQRLVLTDGVFSMDGDLAPLTDLVEYCHRYQAWLAVDDAHALGVLGPAGRGTVAGRWSQQQVPVLIGTLGKAFGTAGAFVAGSQVLADALVQWGRTGIYTTAMPPALAVATRAALDLVRKADDRRRRLSEHVDRFRHGAAQAGLPLLPSETPIQPLQVGDAQAAVNLARQLRQRGLLVSAIRPPTVPEGTSRLRITLSAAHRSADIERLLQALAECLALG